MSKRVQLFRLVLPTFVLGLLLVGGSHGQQLNVTVRLDARAPGKANVVGSYAAKADKNFGFVREYAGAAGLGTRFSEVGLTDKGRPVEARQLIPGEYLAKAAFDGWSYTADLSPRKERSAAAHVSWVSDEAGILMLRDLLPIGGASAASVEIVLPDGWRVSSSEKRINGKFRVDDAENAVFVIGKQLREHPLNALNVQFISSGEWQFTDAEAGEMIAEIYGEYTKLFDSRPPNTAQVVMLRFPQQAPPGAWEADTRGRNVTIISSDMPFKTQTLQRLHEQLRHELFHLWIPNGVNLSGNYDWFYEGFTLYQSLKTALATNRIRFSDFLDTLARAHTIDSISSQRRSLLDASRTRWAGGNTQVYARGMLAGFLADVIMLERSRGRRSVSDLFKQLYDDHKHPSESADGNSAVIAVLGRQEGLQPVIDRYIKGPDPIDWGTALAAAGIVSTSENGVTRLAVAAKPNGRQRALLDKLGYNNWRRSTRRSQ